MNKRALVLVVPVLASAALALRRLAAHDSAPESAATLRDAPIAGPSDARLDPRRAELLDLAFAAASRMPLEPHLKNRSRAQESVVEASLALGQEARALAQAGEIVNWRRGCAYAELALRRAEAGDAAGAARFVELAERVAGDVAKRLAEPEGDDFAVESPQDWHLERVRAAVARARAALERGGPAGAPSDLDAELEALAAASASTSFDELRAAVAGYVALHARCADAGSRERVRAELDARSAALPPSLRVDALAELCDAALARGERAEALALVERAREVADASSWSLVDHVLARARLAGLRARAGDDEGARRDGEAARREFAARRDSVADVERAGVLRALAEAHRWIDGGARATELYAEALEAGVANPNSRPRAEDVAATCCSLALSGLEPDARLVARAREIVAALGHPW